MSDKEVQLFCIAMQILIHSISQHYIAFHITTLHFTTLHCISHHYIAFYNTTSHNTTYHAILYHYLLRYIFLRSHAPQATFCGMTVVFCRKLNWTHLASCLETYTGRLGFGVRDELLALVRMGSEVSFLIPSISYIII